MNGYRYSDNDKQHAQDYCGVYEENDFTRLVQGAMSEREIERFNMHCSTCDSCSAALTGYQRKLYYENDQKENTALLNKTMELLNKIDTEQ